MRLKVRRHFTSSHETIVFGRVHIAIRGAVQGVGFRPFVYRLARELGLGGWVLNSPQGVFIEAEGPRDILSTFVLRLEKEKPPRSFIQSLEYSFLDPLGFTGFEIRESESRGERTALVLPDCSTCADCLADIFDPANRRYLYPFTNCTNCGPRFTIIERLPYDRPNTSMKLFVMCEKCRHEYEDPLDRRFHAQPNACPVCGPQLELWDGQGTVLALRHEALLKAVESIRLGKIVALKGIGGFHLLVDARNEEAVLQLRSRKHREEKPLALMLPTVEATRALCNVSELEERLLRSPESPIVLLQRTIQDSGPGTPDSNLKKVGLPSAIAPSIAPHNPYLGVMLPYTPLHHLMMRELGIPIVATSGNLSDEPICTDEHEAVSRLRGIADLFLVHNRPIVRHVDDSVVRVMMERELVLRRARGYAPLPVSMKSHANDLLAVGAHLKNAVAVARGHNVFISQHIGDLETSESYEAFRDAVSDLKALYSIVPAKVVSDLHPEYLSTKYAKSSGSDLLSVQHHYAHTASCMAENELSGRVLGVSWDGTGYGLDHTIWGGEFLLTDDRSFRRVASFRQFRLPGGEAAIKEPRRTALGMLFEIFGDGWATTEDLFPLKAFTPSEFGLLQRMVTQAINSPITSSVGRLFDGVASLIGMRQKIAFEGQAAMELEFAIAREHTDRTYGFRVSDWQFRKDDAVSAIKESAPAVAYLIDWEPMVLQILEDLRQRVPAGVISAKFHNTLAEIIVDIAGRIGEERVVLSGGCFQNKYLTERTVRRLETRGFRPYWHQRVPPNDGGIALGQVYAAVQAMQSRLQLGGDHYHAIHASARVRPLPDET